MGGMVPTLEEGARSERRDRRLRANTPNSLLSGPAAKRPIALAQAYLAAGAAVTGTLAAVLPHPAYFDITGLLLIQGAAACWALVMYLAAGRMPVGLMRLGPACATMLTTAAVIFSGNPISGYALMYLWVGLYVFYFPLSKFDAAAQRHLGGTQLRLRDRRHAHPARGRAPGDQPLRDHRRNLDHCRDAPHLPEDPRRAPAQQVDRCCPHRCAHRASESCCAA